MGSPVKERSINAFDFLVVAFLNVGYYLSKAKKHAAVDGAAEPEFYVLTPEFLRIHYRKSGRWGKIMPRGLDIDAYRGSKGFDLIAQALDIPYPAKWSDVSRSYKRIPSREEQNTRLWQK